MLFLPAVLGAQESGISIGIGVEPTFRDIDIEPNRIIIENLGFGGLFQADYRFNSLFAIGVRGGVSYSPFTEYDRLLTYRGDTFFRWYFYRPLNAHFFLQAGMGLMSTHRGWDAENARGTFDVGGAAGVRFLLPHNWYIEVFARVGYPFIVGTGFAFGLRIHPKVKVSTVEKVVEVEKIVEVEKFVEVPVEVERAVEVMKFVEVPAEVEKIVEVRNPVEVPVEKEKPLPESFPLFFGPNGSSLFSSTLGSTTRRQNETTLNQVVKLLVENPRFRLRVEGYANPVLKTRAESINELVPISRSRAQVVADWLVRQGIVRDRLVVLANGGNNSYPKGGAQNRRVDLHVIR
ncbi:hypothetical protein AGMMS49944_15320 [Spirochaetia bacterium]|nr:hypothetical protein AGMMS49944_15320 [Spirochaetia bacterium]